MESVKKFVGWVLKSLGALALLLILIAVGIFIFSRQERALAREFLQLTGKKEYEAAFNLTSKEMQSIYPLQKLKSQFDTIQAYTDVSFTSVHVSGGKTTLTGTASTADNCISTIVFIIEENKIATFRIDNACTTDETSA